jgi:hypothetical protein
MKNIKVSKETHEDLIEWVTHKEIKLTDIIDKIINTGLMTEKYGLSFFQSIIEKEGYLSKDKIEKLKDELKKEFFEKGLVQGFEQGKSEGFKESQELQKKSKKIKDIKKKPDIKKTKPIVKKEVKKESKIVEIPQYDPDDIYGEKKNTRFIRLEEKRKK